MRPVFHEGEQAVQQRAGVQEMANRVGSSIHEELPAAAQQFLLRQPFAILGGAAESGAIWASLLTGAPGFLSALDARTVRIQALPVAGDPLLAALGEGSGEQKAQTVGMLAIELATRKRMRVNGSAELRKGEILLHVQQAYANCPKYIQARALTASSPVNYRPGAAQRGNSLTRDQWRWIEQADTFFIATRHPQQGADASHRGGSPGFVKVSRPDLLLFPDYAGNNMFNTLGNLSANPRAGLLFLNFETGDTLQLTGEAEVSWDEALAAQFAGAQRVVQFRIASVLQTNSVMPLQWRLEQYSPFNPK